MRSEDGLIYFSRKSKLCCSRRGCRVFGERRKSGKVVVCARRETGVLLGGWESRGNILYAGGGDGLDVRGIGGGY